MHYHIEFQANNKFGISSSTRVKEFDLNLFEFALREKEMFGSHLAWFLATGYLKFIEGIRLYKVKKLLNEGIIKRFEYCETVEEGLASIIDIETKRIMEKIDLLLIYKVEKYKNIKKL